MGDERTHIPLTVPPDAVAPRCDEERFRIYTRSGDELTLLATAATPAAVGVALFTLDEDEREAGTRGLIDRGIVGILDCMAGVRGRWVISPWIRPTG